MANTLYIISQIYILCVYQQSKYCAWRMCTCTREGLIFNVIWEVLVTGLCRMVPQNWFSIGRSIAPLLSGSWRPIPGTCPVSLGAKTTSHLQLDSARYVM